ncbi:jacalin-related lectin 19-like [Musa acuminata AAA Group]|uniref:jacalin-related lectin 19 n=1 Tax=Musa acuminata AAA Group TaxID=214697 RepID=UPI0031CF1D72
MQAQKKVVGSSKTLKVGPWGGHGGSTWDDGINTGVREITLVYDQCIDSIRVEYDKNGKPFLAEKHGGNGGSTTTKIKLEHPEEYLTTISGHYCPMAYGGSPVIRSLTFKSNQRTFGPFGVQDGIPFTLPMEGGMIVGFSGRCGWYLDAIGWCISPFRTVKLYETLQHKIQRIGTMASRTLGNRDDQNGALATTKPRKTYA